MGYVIVDDFTGNRSTIIPVNNSFYNVNFRDWNWDFNRNNKEKQLYLTFTGGGIYTDSYIDFVLNKEYCIYCEDVYGKTFSYDYLVLTWKEEIINLNNDSIVGSSYRLSERISMSLSLYYDNFKLGEFLIFPNIGAYNKCGYSYHFIDLSIFKDSNIKKFNKVRINILSNLGRFSKIYFGDLYLLQDSVEHNLLVSLSRELHNIYYEKCGTILEVGEDYIIANDLYDVEDGYCIAIANNEKELKSFLSKVVGYNYFDYENNLESVEIHQIKSIELLDNGYKLVFYDNFDGSNLIYKWKFGTELFFVVPTIIDDFIDESYKMPAISITYNFPEIDKLNTTRNDKVFNIMVDRENNKFNYGLIKTFNCLKIELTISVFANNIELSNKLVNIVRNKIDGLGYISIFDLYFDIEDIDVRTISVFDEYSPSAEFSLSINCFEKFSDIDYNKLYVFKEIDLEVDVL